MTADTIGGVWTYALDLARALAAHGVYFEIATMGAALSATQQAEADALPNVRVNSSDFKLEWMGEPWADVAAAGEWLLALEREMQPDIVHLNGFAHGVLPFHAPVLVVGHSCVLSWWKAVKDEDAPPEWDAYQNAVRHGLRGADVIAAPTQAMLNALQEHYGPFPDTIKTRVLWNSGDPARFSQADPQEKEPLIFAAGRLWDEAKNIAALDAVAPTLPWPVVVAGAGGDTVSGGGTARRLGQLPPGELADWLRRAAIYALPARYEPFGLSILEAALAGCALVLGDIPSLREVWGNAACFVDPADTAALRSALCCLCQDAAERTRLVQAARARALALYTVERMATGYLAAYRDAAVVRACR